MIILLHGNDNRSIKSLRSKFSEDKKHYFTSKIDHIDGIDDFYTVKKFILERVFSAIYSNKIAVIDANCFSSLKTNNERLYIDLLLKSMGVLNIVCSDNVSVESSADVFIYNKDVTFFEDVLRKIEEFKIRLTENRLYSNLKSFAGFGYYLGDVMNASDNINQIKGPSGEVIDFDDYMSFLISNPEQINNSNITLVRTNHPTAYLVKTILNKK